MSSIFIGGSINPSFGDLEVFLITLNADELPPSVHAGNAGGATSHGVVEHCLPFVGVGADQVFHQGDRLLGGVDFVD